MSTSPKTPPTSPDNISRAARRYLLAWCAACACCTTAMAQGSSTAPANPAVPPPADTGGLQCSWRVIQPRSGRVLLRFTLRNTGRRMAHVLEWATPLEGWTAPYVQVTRDGVELPYHGAMVKRGDPGLTEYHRLPPGMHLGISVDLGQAFDITAPGRYTVTSHITLFDVQWGARAEARARGEQKPLDLPCAAVHFERGAARK